MLKLLHWLDDNLIGLLAGFLLVFIPLYPKLPLFDILPGYIVRVRLEDFFVSLTVLLWMVWLLRKKLNIGPNPLLKLIGLYLIAGLLSMFTAVFLLKTVPLETVHVGKMILHFLRRIEYFSLFFIFYSSIKSLKQVKYYIILLVLTMVGVIIYGYGQKYLYWPAFSTMNREFSKGWVLYLSAHARVLSTFGGHYDLAAFTMMLLVFLWSLLLNIKKIIWRAGLFIVWGASLWLLILTASRASFVAYLAGITVVSFLCAFRIGVKKSLIAWAAISFLSIIIMFSFGDLSDRFTKFLKIDQRLTGIKSLVMSPLGAPPGNQALFLENNEHNIAAVTAKSDQPPSTQKPVDVTNSPPLLIPVPGSSTTSAIARTYSSNSLVYDLSTGIRLDALWPHAIKGFLREPLLGSGYSTLNKNQPTDFTEAESTDNDFLRTLGETGLIGFLTFYAVIITIIVLIWRSFLYVKDPLFFALLLGLAGLTAGLLANAVLIDVFESSKVAFSFWAIAGITLGGLKTLKKDKVVFYKSPSWEAYRTYLRNSYTWFTKFIKSDVFILGFILLLAFILRLYKIDAPLADWHSWRQADTSAVTRNYVRHGINILFPTYDDLSNVASGKDNLKGLRMVEFPVYNVLSVIADKMAVGNSVEFSGRFTTIIISLISTIFLFKLVKKYSGRKTAALAAFFFAVIPYSIYYSRVILPEPLLVASSLGLLYYFDKWLENAALSAFVLTFIFGASALLVKPFAAFMIFPLLYLSYRKWKFSYLTKPQLYILALLILVPLMLWRFWISHYPEGIPAFTWLLNGDNIRFKGAFFYWLFADRLGRLILGYWGLPLLLIGFLAKPKKEGLLYYWFAIGMIVYLAVIATGNVRHDYYQIFIIPVITVFVAKGVIFIFEESNSMVNKGLRILLILFMILGMEAFGWYHIKDYFNINHPEIVEAGQTADQILPSKALVIAPYNGDTAFLYQTGRKGWPIMEGSIDDMIKRGAHYFISVNFDELTKDIMKDTTLVKPKDGRFKVVKYTNKYVIIQLVPDKKLPKDQ